AVHREHRAISAEASRGRLTIRRRPALVVIRVGARVVRLKVSKQFTYGPRRDFGNGYATALRQIAIGGSCPCEGPLRRPPSQSCVRLSPCPYLRRPRIRPPQSSSTTSCTASPCSSRPNPPIHRA